MYNRTWFLYLLVQFYYPDNLCVFYRYEAIIKKIKVDVHLVVVYTYL